MSAGRSRRVQSHFPWSRKIGPLKLNGNKHRITSWSIAIGRFTWNSKRGLTIDTPGPGYVKVGKRRR